LPDPNFVIRLIDPTDRVGRLKLRSEDGALAAFLKRHCVRYHTENLAKTYVYVDDNSDAPRKVVAYISILVGEVNNADAVVPDLPDYSFSYPSVKIARLAVDLSIQRNGLGGNLVDYSLAVIKRHIAPHVGCRFVVVDANPPAIDFYRKHGFVLVDTDENRKRDHPLMFYDLLKVA
jgi:ribosomal protein S18 acetylase RimI-like enzyme